MQMQVTNKIQGRTGGGILKTAEIGRTKAGTVEVFVTLPNGHKAAAILTDSGNMALQDAYGFVGCVSLSDTAENKLDSLTRRAEEMMLSD